MGERTSPNAGSTRTSTSRKRPRHRFPLHPLIAASRAHTVDALALMLDLPATSLRKKAERGLTLAEADRYACACGLHPATVYGELWWAEDATALLFARIRNELATT